MDTLIQNNIQLYVISDAKNIDTKVIKHLPKTGEISILRNCNIAVPKWETLFSPACGGCEYD